MKQRKMCLIVLFAAGLSANAGMAQRAGRDGRPEHKPPGASWYAPLHAPYSRRLVDTPPLKRPPLPKTEAERKALSVLDNLHRNHRHGMNISVADGRLLRVLTESIGAKHVVELGTMNGYSAIWLCLALQNTGGRLATYEIDPDWASQARENFKRAGVEQIVMLVEGDAHVEVRKLKEPIDLLFIDADKRGYVDYLNKLLPLVRPGGLIVGHNMIRPPPAPAYLEAITTNPDLETIFLNTDGAGVGVTLKKR